jgi:hypothetical protein
MSASNNSEGDAHDFFHVDVEQKTVDDASLKNDTVQNFAWQGISVTVKDRETKSPKAILSNIDGYVEPGEFCEYILNSFALLPMSFQCSLLH